MFPDKFGIFLLTNILQVSTRSFRKTHVSSASVLPAESERLNHLLRAVKERVIPYSGGDEDIHPLTVTVPVGTTIFVSIAGSNRLESVWGADAKEWKPERWLTEAAPTSNSRLRLPGIYSGM